MKKIYHTDLELIWIPPSRSPIYLINAVYFPKGGPLRLLRPLAVTVDACAGSPIKLRGASAERLPHVSGHESPRTAKLYDRTKERLTQDEVERIRL